MKSFAECLTGARKARGLTQEQLADAVHVTRAAVSSWERGRTEPDLDTLKKLCDALQCDLYPKPDTTEPADAAPIAEAPETAPASSQQAKRVSPLRTLVPLAAAVIVILCAVLWIIPALTGRNNPASGYTPLARAADENGTLTVEFFQQACPTAEGMPALEFTGESETAEADGTTIWFYTFAFRETNGVRFNIEKAVVYEFPPNHAPITFPFSAQQLTEAGMSDRIEPRGQWSLNGGFPLQDMQGVAIVLYGTDDAGHEMEFHGYIPYDA